MSRAWAGGSTRRWRKTRLLVLIRDNWQCRLKLDVCTTRADCVHHTKGRAVTGDDPQFMVAACTSCNLKVGDPGKTVDPKPKRMTEW